MAPDKVLSPSEWFELIGVSESTGRRLLAEGEGPAVVRLSKRRLGITVPAHQDWLRRRTATSELTDLVPETSADLRKLL